MATVPHLYSPHCARLTTVEGTFSPRLHPWPFHLRNFGSEPEDWAAEGYSAYFGLEFPGVVQYPPAGICDFLVPASWTIEGEFPAGSFNHLGNTYDYPGGTFGPDTFKTGEAGDFGATADETWDELDSALEVFYVQNITWSGYQLLCRARALTGTVVTATCVGQPDIAVEIRAEALAFLPQCCKNEMGDVVWRMRISGSIDLEHFDGDYIAIDSQIGLDFVDSDFWSNSQSFDPPGGGYTLTFTVEREAYVA